MQISSPATLVIASLPEETPSILERIEKNKHKIMRSNTIQRQGSSLLRHYRPMHWHGSMIVAIAAILLTSLKCSGEMVRALHTAVPNHATVIDSTFMRDAETGHSAVLLGGGVRTPALSGK